MPDSAKQMPERAKTTARCGAAICGLTRCGWTPTDLQVNLPGTSTPHEVDDGVPRYYRWIRRVVSSVTWTRRS